MAQAFGPRAAVQTEPLEIIQVILSLLVCSRPYRPSWSPDHHGTKGNQIHTQQVLSMSTVRRWNASSDPHSFKLNSEAKAVTLSYCLLCCQDWILSCREQQLTDNVQLNLPSQRAWQWEQLAGSCWTDDLHPSQFIFQVIETVFHRSHQQIVALIYFLLFINHLCLFWTHCSTTTGTQKRHRLSKMARIQRALEWFTDLFEPLPFLWNLKAVLNTNSVKLIKYEAYKNKTLALRYCWRGTGVPRLLWASSHKGFMFLGLAGLPDRTTSGQSGPTDSGLRPPWWVEGNTKNPGRGRKEQEVDPSKKHTLLHIHQ